MLGSHVSWKGQWNGLLGKWEEGEPGAPLPEQPALLLETSEYLLLETGGFLLLES